MNVFISYSHHDRDFAMELAKTLRENGHSVVGSDDSRPGGEQLKAVAEGITKADAVVIVISESSAQSGVLANEIAIALALHEKKGTQIIPVVVGEHTKVPAELAGFQAVVVPCEPNDSYVAYESREDLQAAVAHSNAIQKERKNKIDRILLSLSVRDSEIKDEKAKEKASEEKVQTGLSTYLNETMTRLRANESRNKVFAYILYVLSIAPLFAAIAIVFRNPIVQNEAADTPVTLVIRAITELLIIILFISTSKLMFNLAKSFMVEAIRCSDRIHAISFGKFFLDAYGKDATREEVLKAFSTWNIDDGKTSFRNLSGEDYDPKLEKVLSTIADVYKGK